jgi:multicomponent Na+:H+ antiporter subunit D
MSAVEFVPALLIVVPIVGATLPLALGLRFERVGWWVAAAVLAVEAALAAWLAHTALVGGERVVHVLGGETFGRKSRELATGESTDGFAVGIELVGDALSGALVALVAVVALGVLAFARREGPRGNPFYSAYLVLSGGLMGVVLTGDLFNLFVFLEITGLAAYALVARGQSGASAVAALKYLVIGTTGASLYLVGVGYLFVSTGALNMVDVSRSLAGDVNWVEAPLYGETTVLAAFGFVATGLMAKIAIFPLHTWQPDAYAESPDAVTVYISALVSTASAYALARVTWHVFTPEFFAASAAAELLLNAVLAFAALSVLVGSVLAVMQRRIKRTFAYSSVAQFGLILLGIGVAVHPAGGDAATRFAVFGVVVHLFAHGLIKGGLFTAAGAIAAGSGARTVREYAGLATEHPILSGAMTALGLSIIGVPPTLGFLGKWYLAVGAVEAGLWPVALVVFASTLLTLLYVARISEKLYFDAPPATIGSDPEASELVADGGRALGLGVVGVAVGAALAAVVLGLGGGTFTEWVEPVAEAVVEASPEVTA